MRKLILFLLFNLTAQASTFHDVVNQYLERNPDFNSKKINLSQARYKERTASVFWTPSLNLSLGKSRLQTSNTWSDYSQVDASINLFKFGGDYFNLIAAKALTRSNEQKLIYAQRLAEAEIADLLFERIKTHNEIEILNRMYKIKTDAVKIAEINYSQGKLHQQEVEKTKIDRDLTLIRLRNTQNSELLLIAKIKQYAQEDLTDQNWPWLLSLEKKIELKESNQNLPQVESLKEDVLYNQYTKKNLISTFLPRIDFGASWKNQNINFGENGSWTLNLSMTMSIWNQLNDLGNYRIQAEKEALAQRNLDIETNLVQETFKQFNQRLELKRSNAQSSRLAVKKYQSFYKDGLKSFELGRITVNDLFIEQTRLFESELADQSSLKNYHNILVEYCHLQQKSITDCSL